MKGKGSAAVGVFTAIVLVLLFLCPVAWAGDSGDIYTARTVDGVDLAMWRYRPDPQSPLREGAQPVILMPGMGPVA